ncbi:MAG: cell division protein FtsL [Gammaproteobacteria bacterium]|jgi:cell division protein FtsL
MNLRIATLCLIAGAMLASSVALVYVQHVRRDLFMELKSLEHGRDQMDVEWGQLQLESSTLAAQERIEKIATEQLQFHVPVPTAMVLVRP